MTKRTSGSWRRRLFRAAAYSLQRVRQAAWRFTGKPAGVLALPITAEGTIVLVRLSYANGWRLPGGGWKRGESAETAMLRELREEIGLLAYHSAEAVQDFGPDASDGLFVVRGVTYCPRRSLEIDAVQAFGLDALPRDTSARTRLVIERTLPLMALESSP